MKFLKHFIIPFLILLLALFIRYMLPHLAFLPEELQTLIQTIAKILVIATFTWVVIALIRIAKINFLKKYDISEADNLRFRKLHTQYNILEKILVFIVIIIAIGFTLMLFENVRNIGISLFASAGIAGLVLGLAAQKALGTILAGFQIAITQPIRLEDVVIVENEWGWIEEINLTYVVIRIWDKRRLVVPTTYFLETPFQNWTRVSADILGTVFIYTDYTMPIAALREELTRLLNTHPNWDRQVDVLQVTDAREHTLELRALMSAESSPKAWELRVFIREKLIEFIQREYPGCLPKTRVSMDKYNDTANL
ncbi:MAG: mechanosensitive ion channel family protein [Bacteroidales bacterium]